MVAVMRDNDLYLTVPMGYQLVNGRYKVTDGAVTSNRVINQRMLKRVVY